MKGPTGLVHDEDSPLLFRNGVVCVSSYGQTGKQTLVALLQGNDAILEGLTL